MLDHGNWRETVRFQLSVYAISLSLRSTAAGPDATALKFTVSRPAFPVAVFQGANPAKAAGRGLTRIGWLVLVPVEIFPSKPVDLTPAEASSPFVNCPVWK